jgi:hypothetical protein
MGKYRVLGSFLDRIYRNNLNDNFNDVDADIQAQKKRVDDLIIANPSPSEVQDARLGFPVLRDKLVDVDAQLAEKATKSEEGIRTSQSNPTNFSGAIVTIIDDDARPDFRTVWKPILTDNPSVKIDIAVVKDWTENGSSLSLSELLELQNQGHGILCHTAHHEASYSITPENAEADYPVAINWMKDNGLKGYEYLVYPGGLSKSTVSIKNIARKHFKYAISTESAGDYAVTPVDNWCIGRINGDAKTLDELKAAVDYAKANKIWLILMTHSHVLLSAGSQKMRDFIAYVQLQNVPIMKFEEAVKYKGNAVALGEHTAENSLFIGVDSSSKGLLKQEIGTWTPSLIGLTTAGTHTYSTRKGDWMKIGKLMIATFDINIASSGLDATMAGSLRITGLPFTSQTISRSSLEYNILNLGTNFTSILAAVNAPDNVIRLFKTGNGVATTFVNASDIPAGQSVIFRGQVMCHIS